MHGSRLETAYAGLGGRFAPTAVENIPVDAHGVETWHVGDFEKDKWFAVAAWVKGCLCAALNDGLLSHSPRVLKRYEKTA